MLLASLEAFLCQLAPRRSARCWIVDEAQNLTPRAVEELRMLSNFQLGDQALLQSFLVGQPELREIMQSPQMQQLRQRVIASYHLGPLDAAETQAYIEHRLQHVGWKDDPRSIRRASSPSTRTPAAFRGGSTPSAIACCWRLPGREARARAERRAGDRARDPRGARGRTRALAAGARWSAARRRIGR